MTAIARLGDMSSGADLFPPRSSNSASPDVFINNKGVHRKGDTWNAHHITTDSTTSGSPNVFVNNQPVARVGDSISCSDTIAQGSPDTFAN